MPVSNGIYGGYLHNFSRSRNLSHYINNCTKLLTPVLAQLVHNEHHTKTIHLLMQYIKASCKVNSTTEVQKMLSEVTEAHVANAVVLMPMLDHLRVRLEVSPFFT